MKNPEFLKNKYDLHNAPEVKSPKTRRKEKETGEKIPEPGQPEENIQKYLDRLERLIMDPNKEQKSKTIGGETRPRALAMLREMVMNKYVRQHKEKMAAGAAQVEERAAREMGINAQYGEEEIEQRGEIAVEDLEKSLDNWIMYLSDANEPYPMWFRYYAFRNILNLGDYDKDKGEFPKRSQGTARLFPDVDRGALAYIQQMIEASKDPKTLERIKKAQEATANNDIPQDQLITQQKVNQFAKMSFAKQYAEGIKQAGEITPEMREITEGKWVKYQKDTDPTALWASLQNKGTAWCTKGFATAETQLKGGDFYVYYTLDKQGQPTIPRIAIRMQENNIGEVRGVADNQQNLEGNMMEIAEEKIDTLPGKEEYKRKTADMKKLTEIEKKTKDNQELTKEELTFLYEIDENIQGFGYDKDPRIKELQETRNKDEDMLIVFECEPNQIAKSVEEINENTKAYVGEWSVEIFQKIRNYPNVTHLYESFPDKKIFKMNLETDFNINSPEKAEEALKEKNIYLSDWGKDILQKTEFSQEKKKYNLVRFTVEQLGFSSGATTDEIYAKAKELGLELCPAEVGPHLRLKYPGKEWMLIAMEQIADRHGLPYVFNLYMYGEQLSLYGSIARPANRWYPAHPFVFSFRK